MKHARHDYDHIQGLEGRIPEDEPVFLLRAQDCAAPAAVRAWADIANSCGAEEDIVTLARRHADAMEAWQKEHKVKVPDMPKDGAKLAQVSWANREYLLFWLGQQQWLVITDCLKRDQEWELCVLSPSGAMYQFTGNHRGLRSWTSVPFNVRCIRA